MRGMQAETCLPLSEIQNFVRVSESAGFRLPRGRLDVMSLWHLPFRYVAVSGELRYVEFFDMC